MLAATFITEYFDLTDEGLQFGFDSQDNRVGLYVQGKLICLFPKLDFSFFIERQQQD